MRRELQHRMAVDEVEVIVGEGEALAVHHMKRASQIALLKISRR